MDRYRVHSDVTRKSPPNESWLFAQAISRKPVPEPSAAEMHAREEREQWEWLARISTRAGEELRRIRRREVEEREVRQRWEQACERYHTQEDWDPTQHPRLGGPPNAGWFASKGGVGGGGLSQLAAGNPSDPSHWYLPSDDTGVWLGAKGDSTFRLKTPVGTKGKLVREIQFTKGVPVLDKFALPGKTATIILTGHHKTDIRHAEVAWRNLNPGEDFPANATFHHDLLHATEHRVTIDGKRTKILVGKMQLVPKYINKAVFHEGSASVAKKYYQGLGVDVGSVARLAKDEARLAGKSRTIVARALGNIKSGTIAKGIAPFVGRSVVRAIPLIGTGLAVLEFAENVEAHGIGGALARATPVLGDLISAHDLGSELAKQIRDEADEAAGEYLRSLNEPVRKAWEEADAQTIAAFHELAPHIKVTNQPLSAGGGALVDPQEIADALNAYRNQMRLANYQRISQARGFIFSAAAARYKQELRDRLEQASQRHAPMPRDLMAEPIF